MRTVREHLFDRLSCEQVLQLREICRTVLAGMTTTQLQQIGLPPADVPAS